ncbi:MAG: hypothetical protein FE044_01970 [Thermoplasmata archaeon]|nr:MAG: hypothetical protein FE044_01970 [Thermoplasmata archaeon]
MNRKGISAMHDAILFVTLVSISGVILLPAFINNPITQSEIEREGSETADESLIVLLSLTPKEFNYTLAKETIDGVMNKAGISSQGDLGKAIFNWLLGIKQYHKSYGELIAEDLASQFLLSLGGKDYRMNILTQDFDKRLKENISKELNKILEGKYKFNLTAKWNPIIGMPFGGKLQVGGAPPQTAYVSKTFISLPFSPVININGVEVHLNRNWIKEKIKDAGVLGEIYDLIDKIPSTDAEWEKFKKHLEENLTELIYEFLFTGIMSPDGNVLLPGIFSVSLHLIFEEIIGYIENSRTFNSFVSSLNNMFGENRNVIDYLINLILDEVYNALGLQPQGENIDEKLEGLIGALVNYIVSSLKNSEFGEILKEYISDFVDYIVEMIKKGGEVIKEAKNMIDDWLLNRISISRAEISLAIWEE